MPGTGRRLAERLGAPIDGASLGCFRAAVGAILLFEILDYARHGWIARYWIDPAWHFPYWGFAWVAPWPGAWMYLHFAALAIFAVGLALGLFSRTCAALFCAGFTWIFLIDQARYMNHLYLVCLLAGLLAVVPAGRAFSIDALRAGFARGPWVPAWSLLLLRAQVALVYVFGGLAKLSPDWLAGAPMRLVLSRAPALPEPLDAWLTSEWAARFFTFGGLGFDLLVVPALLWRRTRPLAAVASLAFHLINAWLFEIGIFPFLMLVATTLFFEPGWPRRALSRFDRSAASPSPAGPGSAIPTWLGALLSLYLAVQVLLPLRHLLYPGDPSWTEEGHRFAWRMKLHVKQGALPRIFVVADGQRYAVDLAAHLARWQAMRMATRPEMLHAFAIHLAELLRERGARQVEVHADARASLNGRPLRPLVDPDADLAAAPRTLAPARWILPLDEPLPPERRLPRRPSGGGGD